MSGPGCLCSGLQFVTVSNRTWTLSDMRTTPSHIEWFLWTSLGENFFGLRPCKCGKPGSVQRPEIVSPKKCHFSVFHLLHCDVRLYAGWGPPCQVLQKGGSTLFTFYRISIDHFMINVFTKLQQGVSKVEQAFEKRKNPHIEQLTLREWIWDKLRPRLDHLPLFEIYNDNS